MRWFGPTWNAAVNWGCEEAQTPIGAPCTGCDMEIIPGDQGILLTGLIPDEAFKGDNFDEKEKAMHTSEQPWHLTCLLKKIL